MAWKFYRDGRALEAELERWRWEAHYDDGSILKQFDDGGIYHQFKEIEQDRLASFWMVSDRAPPICIQWKPGYKLIHFYRNSFSSDNFADRTKLYCFGFQNGSDKHMIAIMPDDGLIVTDNIDTVRWE